MDRYEAHIKKHYGEYIYAQICSKIAIALNNMHQEEGCKPDFIIEKGIEFTTKSQFCLEKYDKALWDEIYAIPPGNTDNWQRMIRMPAGYISM